MSELTDATAAITALIASYGQTRDELVEVMTTPADGGVAGDGKVQVTLPNGSKAKLESIAAAYAKLDSGAAAKDYVDRVAIDMAAKFIALQALIVQRWNDEDARD